MGSSPPPTLSGPTLPAELESSFRQIVTDACESHPHLRDFLIDFHFKDGNIRYSQIDQYLSSSPFSSSQANRLESQNFLSTTTPNNPPSSVHASSASLLRTSTGNPDNSIHNNENPATQANILPMGTNSRPDGPNPIHNQSVTPMPTEIIPNFINSVPANSGGDECGDEGGVIRSAARSRAPWKRMYESRLMFHSIAGGSSLRNQPEPNQYCGCIMKTVMEGQTMPSLRTCPVHEPSYELLDLSVLTSHVPPPPPIEKHPDDVISSMGGSLPNHENVGEWVPAPLNSTIQHGFNSQRMKDSLPCHQNVEGLVPAPLNSTIQHGLHSQRLTYLIAGALPSHQNVGGLVPALSNSTIQEELDSQSDDVISKMTASLPSHQYVEELVPFSLNSTIQHEVDSQRMAGSLPCHQNVGGLVPAPLNSAIQYELDSQRPQRQNTASIFDLELKAAQPSTTFSYFQVPQSHRQWTGNAIDLGSCSLVHGHSIQSIQTITSPIVSTTAVIPNDELLEITYERDNLQLESQDFSISSEAAKLEQFVKQFEALIHVDQMDWNNDALETS
ncbi:OLC1v1037003C1 [Oldenlandia corymbosa var. corymbosa]|uniref:OLC1v1037003C1 n=1 Tax=Oldenlandia corymbosa var. corymbosa TaxID=529605 RepID=A0AAV1CZU4_OLDCO|nr:OLC1v1037003C1 [Oldenlandia corymbosa var. corymbosa]